MNYSIENNSSNVENLNEKHDYNMLIITIFAISMVCFVIFHCYDMCSRYNYNQNENNDNNNHVIENYDETENYNEFEIIEINFNYNKNIYKNIYLKIESNEIDNFENKICSICIECLNNREATIVKMNNCNHYFHEQCIQPWLNQNMNCPLCRKEYKLHL